MAAAKTGNKTTITFATSAFAGLCTQIGSYSETRPVLPDSHLGTLQYEEVIPGDLVAVDGLECEMYWDPATSSTPPILAPAELITITLPLGANQSTPATIQGTGFISARTSPVIENNARLMGTFTIQFDGKTGPTVTTGSA
jgi:hypothetical protein